MAQTQVSLESAEWSSHRWTSDDGLPQNSVQAICQTRDGYLWVGTRFGLARFDGVRFRAFTRTNTPELAQDDVICALAPGEKDTLWVGTFNGLLRYEDGKFSPVAALRGQRVWAICEDGEGVLWVGLNSGLHTLRNGTLTRFEMPADQGVRSIFAVGETLRITTLRGLFVINPKSREVQNWNLADVKPAAAPPHRVESGRAWTEVPGAPGEIFPIALVTMNVWGARVGPLGNGFSFLDLNGRFFRIEGGESRRISPPSYEDVEGFLCAMMDAEGNIWLGSKIAGLIRLRPRTIWTLHGKPADDSFFTVTAEGDSVWAGAKTNLVKFSPDGTEMFPVFGHLAGQTQIRSLLMETNGDWWIGLNRAGLARFSKGETLDFGELAGVKGLRVHALHRGRDGALLIGSNRGVIRFDGLSSRQFGRDPGLEALDVRAFHEDRAGRLWIGTLGGGIGVLEGDRFRTLTTKDGLAGNTAWGFCEDRRGDLWVIGSDGVTRVRGGKLSAVTSRQGLFDDVNNQMFEDEFDTFWFGCNRGIYRVRAEEMNAVADGGTNLLACVNYGQSDGLHVAETNGENYPAGCATPDGRLWFPSPSGVIVLDPKRFREDDKPPKAVIESLRAGHLEYPPSGGAAKIPPGQAGVLEIEYTAFNFSAPDRLTFRHRLVGHQDTWFEAGTRRVAFYTKLKPGKYRFEVEARNHHGIRSETIACVDLNVLPAFYQTPAFFLLLAAGVASMIWGAHLLRMRVMGRRLQLEHQLALSRERERIARDMHDNVGATLTQIGLLSDRALRAQRGGAAEPLLAQIHTVSREMTQAMDEIVWAVNPDNDHVAGIGDYICEFAREYLERAGIRCRLEVPPILPSIPVSSETRHQLLMVLMEALSNAARHSKGSEVEVRFEAGKDNMILVVRDNGLGMDGSGQAGRGNGLANLRERAQAVGGSIQISSSPGQGVTVELTVPLRR